MGHQSLVRTMALGAVITLAGSSGIYAVFTDRATTGTNSVSSGDQPITPPDVTDLQIADGTIGTNFQGIACGAFADDSATPLFSATSLASTDYPEARICLKNAGTTTLAIAMAAIDIVDVDTACSSGEAEAGDTTCGQDLQGELSFALVAIVNRNDCANGGVSTQMASDFLASLAFTSLAVPGDPLAPGEIACYWVAINWSGNNSHVDSTIQFTQTDSVTWRFAFDGTTP
jgi:hypothetical protein